MGSFEPRLYGRKNWNYLRFKSPYGPPWYLPNAIFMRASIKSTNTFRVVNTF